MSFKLTPEIRMKQTVFGQPVGEDIRTNSCTLLPFRVTVYPSLSTEVSTNKIHHQPVETPPELSKPGPDEAQTTQEEARMELSSRLYEHSATRRRSKAPQTTLVVSPWSREQYSNSVLSSLSIEVQTIFATLEAVVARHQ
jgi:hypothetical protein